MQELSEQKEKLKGAVAIAFSFCIFCIGMHMIFFVLPYDKYEFSIFPRDLHQWYGIFTGHFIHASWNHLFSNLTPLFVGLGIIFFFYRSIGWAVFSMVLTLTGFAVFVFARGNAHLGASGLVYGFISFIFFSGIFRRNAKSIVLMVIMTLMYSGYTAGFLPTDERVSWESHLFGALSGLWTAFVFRNYREADEKEKRYDWQGQDRSRTTLFFESDTFDKTFEDRKREEEEN